MAVSTHVSAKNRAKKASLRRKGPFCWASAFPPHDTKSEDREFRHARMGISPVTEAMFAGWGAFEGFQRFGRLWIRTVFGADGLGFYPVRSVG